MTFSPSILIAPLLLALLRPAVAADAAALWAGKVQPLFDVQCAKCHGPIEQKGGLELDTPAAVLKGGDEGPAVVPGKPEESRLYQQLAADADPHMPPKKQLSDAERAMIYEWITALATAPAEPAAQAPASPRTFASVTLAVDTFLTESWTQRGLTPAHPVDDSTWARRVTLDLAGRIPTARGYRLFVDTMLTARPRDLGVQRLDALARVQVVHIRALNPVGERLGLGCLEAASAAASTMPPRAILTSVAVGFISASSAAPMVWCDAGE